MNVPVFPPFIQVETLNKCNLNCVMCPITLGENKRPDMEPQLYEKIVLECAKYSEYVKNFAVFMLNEPLLDRNLSTKISFAKKHGIKNTSIATNIELLSTEKILALFDSGLDELVLSIESNVPTIHEKIRVGANFERVKNNVENLLKLKTEMNKDKPKIIVRMLASDENRSEHQEFLDFWIKKGVDAVVIHEQHNWGGQFKNIKPNMVGMNVCTQLWDIMIIQSDGNVCLCCLDTAGDYSLGNVNNESLYDIWHGKKFTQVRKDFVEKQLKKCLNCNWTPYEDVARIEQKNGELITITPLKK